MNKFMQIAIDEAYEGIKNKDGGPFGSCIVKNGEVIASSHNCVLKNNDPTCHGEIETIRKACAKLNTFDLSGCEIYTTGEPCPMCLCACMWAKIDKIYYGCTIEENAKIGFHDADFAQKLSCQVILSNSKKQSFDGQEGPNYLEQIDHTECQKLFQEYKSMHSQKY